MIGSYYMRPAVVCKIICPIICIFLEFYSIYCVEKPSHLQNKCSFTYCQSHKLYACVSYIILLRNIKRFYILQQEKAFLLFTKYIQQLSCKYEALTCFLYVFVLRFLHFCRYYIDYGLFPCCNERNTDIRWFYQQRYSYLSKYERLLTNIVSSRFFQLL